MFVISFAQKKGGVGKSSLAQILYVYLTRIKNHKVVVLDLDSQQQTMDFLKTREELTNTKIICNSPQTYDEFYGLLQRYDSEENTDFCILDLGGYDSKITRGALLASDLIITPLSNTAIDIDGFCKFIIPLNEVLKDNDTSKVCVVLNRIHHADKKSIAKLEQQISEDNTLRNMIVCKNTIPITKEISEQFDCGATPLDAKIILGNGRRVESWCNEIYDACESIKNKKEKI